MEATADRNPLLPLVPLLAVLAAALLVIGVLATSGVALPRSGGGDEGATGLQTLELRGVLAAEEAGFDLVVLEAEGGRDLLPVPVPHEAGETIRRIREGESSGIDPLLRTVDALGGTISEVVLDLDEAGNELSGRVLLSGGESEELSATVGDAIATALASGRPLRATARAVEENGLTRDDLRELLDEHEEAEETVPTIEL